MGINYSMDRQKISQKLQKIMTLITVCIPSDGLLPGTCTGGNSNALRIWDLREQVNVAVMSEHTAC